MSNQVPEGWENCSIGDVAKLQGGYAFKSSDSAENGTRWLKIANVGKGEVKWEEQSYLPKHFEKEHSNFLLAEGDSVVALTRPITQGELKVAQIQSSDVPALINQRVARVLLKHHLVERDFMYALLRYEAIVRDIEITIFGTDPPNVSTKQIEELKINLPPLPEQKKIAAILTSVDDVIEKTQAQINKLKDLKTGMMQELLTCGVGVDGKPHTEFKDSPVGRIPKVWDVDTFDNVFTLKNGVNKGKEFFGQGVPIISYRNVYDGNGIYDHMLNSKVEMSESELSRFRVNKGDIFITRTSETLDEIGFTNVYLGNFDNVVYNGFVIRARQKRKIFDFNYCKYAFQANYMRLQMIHNSKFTTRAGISGESLNLIKIMIPSLSEQKAIGDVLSSVDSRIQALIKSKMSNLSLKKALMQDLLTGKVRVNVD